MSSISVASFRGDGGLAESDKVSRRLEVVWSRGKMSP